MKFFAISMVVLSTFIVVSCNKSEAADASTPATVSAIPEATAVDSRDASIVPAKAPKEVPVQQASKAAVVKDDGPFGRALPLNGTELTDLYLWKNLALLDNKDVMTWYICSMDPTKFGEMIANEFSYNDFYAEKVVEVRSGLAKFETAHFREGEGFLVLARNNGEFGEYDFDSESFGYTPISFDYLTESARGNGQRCNYSGGSINFPDQLPADFHFYFTNKGKITSFSYPKEAARQLIERRTKYGSVDRSVQFEYILMVPPESMVLEQTRYSGKAAVSRTPIYAARIVDTQQDDAVITEFPVSYFE